MFPDSVATFAAAALPTSSRPATISGGAFARENLRRNPTRGVPFTSSCRSTTSSNHLTLEVSITVLFKLHRPCHETYVSFHAHLVEHPRATFNDGRGVLKQVEKCVSGAARSCRTEHMCQRLNVAGQVASSAYIAPQADVRVAEASASPALCGRPGAIVTSLGKRGCSGEELPPFVVLDVTC